MIEREGGGRESGGCAFSAMCLMHHWCKVASKAIGRMDNPFAPRECPTLPRPVRLRRVASRPDSRSLPAASTLPLVVGLIVETTTPSPDKVHLLIVGGPLDSSAVTTPRLSLSPWKGDPSTPLGDLYYNNREHEAPWQACD